MLEHAYSRMTIILVGNKKDLENEREVSYEEGAEFAKKDFLNSSKSCSVNALVWP